MFLPRCRPAWRLSKVSQRQCIHSSASALLPRQSRQRIEHDDNELEFDVNDLPLFDEDDATSAAHLIIDQEKQILNYLRLIERDGPYLRGLVPFYIRFFVFIY